MHSPQIADLRYTLVSRLCTGEESELFRARSEGALGFERTVLIKRLSPDRARDPGMRKRASREAVLCGKLDSSHIVRVYDFYERSDGIFLAMELIDGASLAEVISQLQLDGTYLAIEACLTIATQLADALEYLHKARDPERNTRLEIVHRDLSANHVMLDRRGSIKLIGLGRSQYRGDVQEALDRATSYTPPELFSRIRAVPASDVFSAAALVYELITLEPLQPPPQGMLGEHQPPGFSLEERLSRLPKEARGMLPILRRALAQDPEDRYSSAGALAAALRAVKKPVSSVSPPAILLQQLVARLVALRPAPRTLLETRSEPGLMLEGSGWDGLADLASLAPDPFDDDDDDLGFFDADPDENRQAARNTLNLASAPWAQAPSSASAGASAGASSSPRSSGAQRAQGSHLHAIGRIQPVSASPAKPPAPSANTAALPATTPAGEPMKRPTRSWQLDEDVDPFAQTELSINGLGLSQGASPAAGNLASSRSMPPRAQHPAGFSPQHAVSALFANPSVSPAASPATDSSRRRSSYNPYELDDALPLPLKLSSPSAKPAPPLAVPHEATRTRPAPLDETLLELAPVPSPLVEDHALLELLSQVAATPDLPPASHSGPTLMAAELPPPVRSPSFHDFSLSYLSDGEAPTSLEEDGSGDELSVEALELIDDPNATRILSVQPLESRALELPATPLEHFSTPYEMPELASVAAEHQNRLAPDPFEHTTELELDDELELSSLSNGHALEDAGLEQSSGLALICLYPGQGERIRIPAEGMTVGRDLSNDLVLTHRGVAAHHGAILWEAGRWWLRALRGESVQLQGQAIHEVALEPGLVVQIGGVTLAVVDAHERQAPPTEGFSFNELIEALSVQFPDITHSAPLLRELTLPSLPSDALESDSPYAFWQVAIERLRAMSDLRPFRHVLQVLGRQVPANHVVHRALRCVERLMQPVETSRLSAPGATA